MDRLNNQPIHRWPCLKISTLSISTSPVTVQLSFMLSDYRAMLFWWVLFVTLVFDGVRPLDGQEHGQEHGQVNNKASATRLL
jgi:hypothetical protein